MNGPLCCKWGEKTILGWSIKHWVVSILHFRSYIHSFYYKPWSFVLIILTKEYYLEVWNIINTNSFAKRKRKHTVYKQRQSTELPWTRALSIWGLATLLKGTCPTTTSLSKFLADCSLTEDNTVRCGTPTLQGPQRSTFDRSAILTWNPKI